MIDFIANKKPLFTPDEIDFGGDFGKLVTFTSHYTFDRNFSVSFKVRGLTGTCIHKNGEFKFNLDSNGADDKDMMFHPRAWLFELAEMMSYFDFNENPNVKRIIFIGFDMNITLEPSDDDELERERGRRFGRFNIVRIENMQMSDIYKQCAYMYWLKILIFRKFDYITRNIVIHREFKNKSFNAQDFKLTFRDTLYKFRILGENILESDGDKGAGSKLRNVLLEFLSDWCNCPEVISILEKNLKIQSGMSNSSDIYKLLYLIFKGKFSTDIEDKVICKKFKLNDIHLLRRLSYYIPSDKFVKINDYFTIYQNHVTETRPNLQYTEASDKITNKIEYLSSKDRFVYELVFDGGKFLREYDDLKLHLDTINKDKLTNILKWFEKINTDGVEHEDENGNIEWTNFMVGNYKLFITVDNFLGELYISYRNECEKGKYYITEFNNFKEESIFKQYSDILHKFSFKFFDIPKI